MHRKTEMACGEDTIIHFYFIFADFTSPNNRGKKYIADKTEKYTPLWSRRNLSFVYRMDSPLSASVIASKAPRIVDFLRESILKFVLTITFK